MDVPRPLLDLARLQRGLLSREQLQAHGITRAAVRWALASGRWQGVLPGVVALRPGDLDAAQRLVAARLLAGPSSMISSLTAAAWHGVTSAEDRRVHVAVPYRVNRRGAGFVRVVRTRRPDPRGWDRGVLVISSRARAVADAARDATCDGQAVAVVCEAVERGLVTLAAMRNEVEASAPPGNGAARRALRAAESGAWSLPEHELRSLVDGSRHLPRLWLNPMLAGPDGVRLPTPDGWFDDVALAVQVHSWQWHSGRDQWESTVMSDGVLTEYGIVVVAVTPGALRRSPAQVLARLERVHRHASGRPRPAVSAVPR